MNRLPARFAATCSLLSLLTGPLVGQNEGEDAPVFSRAVVDLGIVVQDLDRSAKFYTEVIGLKEVEGFSVPGEVAANFGLTDDQPIVVRVLVLDDTPGKPATKLKMMAFPDAQGAKSDQEFIHSSLGFSYLTLFVTDMDAAMERLKKAGVKTLGKTPAPLGGNTKITVVRDPDGNFVELIGPSTK